MKKCTYCGKEYPDEATVCTVDQQSLTADGSPAAISRPPVKPAVMVKLRSLHLYLGCIFAPMLLFFAISGIWQTLGISGHLLTVLSTIHTSHKLKAGPSLATPLLRLFNIVMAVAFIVTTILGIVMALNYGRRRSAFYCLALGVAVPLLLVLIGLL